MRLYRSKKHEFKITYKRPSDLSVTTRGKIFRLFPALFCATLLAVGLLFQAGCASPAETALSGQLQVIFIDVGQGDAIAVRSEDSAMLIDAGPNTATDSLLKTLVNRGFTRFDPLVITHPHEEHIGGMDQVIERFTIGRILMPDVTTTTSTFSNLLNSIQRKGLSVSHPAPGDSFPVGTATCTVLAPNAATYDALNNYSIVIRLVYANTAFLLVGDAQTESEHEMLDRGYSLKSDVLKVGHHGSSDATSSEFLKAVAPRYAVISVGRDNDYGHPHAVTLAKLKAADVQIYRTDLNGTITFTSDGSNLTIGTEK